MDPRVLRLHPTDVGETPDCTVLRACGIPLLQIAICLSNAQILVDFGCDLPDGIHDAVRSSICETHLRAPYTVPTDALLRRIPTLTKYLAPWLVEQSSTTDPVSFWTTGDPSASLYPCICLAHTYDPNRLIRYSFRFCSSQADFLA
jgi:hypothetical protein